MTPLWKRIVTYTPLTLVIIVVLGAVLGDDGDPEIPATAASTDASTTTSTSGTSPKNTSSPTSSSNPPTSLPEGSESASVVSVIDGDTIRVDYVGGSNESVRLIGINTPESDECYGPEASTALSVLVDQQNVVMARDVSNRDQFGRLLRYIYLPDGTFVNLVMVRQGYALAREFPPDTSQADVLAAAQAEAEAESLGLWAEDACGTPVDANLIITHVEADAPGNDNENLNGEWVEITNQRLSSTDLTGWVLKDESASHRYNFPSSFILDTGADVRVLTGCGTDTTTSLYWCSGGAVWNNSGDTAFLLDPSGNIHAQYGY